MGRGMWVVALVAMLAPAVARAEPAPVVGARVRLTAKAPADSGRANPARVIYEDASTITVDDPSGEGMITWTRENRWLIGTVEAADDWALIVRASGGPGSVTVRREDITSMAVCEWRRTRGRTALIGAGIGAGAGVLIGFALGDDRPESFPIVLTAPQKALFLGMVLGSAGALIGLAVPPGERWGEVPAGRIRVGLAPLRGGTAAVTLGVAY